MEGRQVAMADDDKLKVLPTSIAPDVVAAAPPPPPPPPTSSSAGAAPSAADQAVADATVAAAPSTPVVSDLAAAPSAAAAPAAAGKAADKKPPNDLAKVRAIQDIIAGTAPGAPTAGPAPVVGVPLAAAPPPATPPTFNPIPPLVADVQPSSAPGMVQPGAIGPGLPPPRPSGAPIGGAAQGPLPPPGAVPDAVSAVGPQAPQFPPPDAITGATLAAPGTGPTVATTPGLTFGLDGQGPGAGPLPPTDEYGQPLGPVAGMTDEQAAAWAENAKPEQLLEQKRLLDLRKSNTAIRKQAEAEAENLRALRENEANLAKANAAAQAKADRIVNDAMAMAAKKPDPNRYMSTRTAGQRLRDILLAVAGGLLQARQGPGARNIGMDMVQREIDQDIEAQKQEIENGRYAIGVRQNAVAEEFKRNGNLYEAAEKVRLATYAAAINRMQTEQQNFDPRGTSFLNYAASISDMRARAADRVEKIRKESFEEDLKKRKEERDDMTAKATIRHQQNEDAIAAGRFGLERDKHRTENQVWTPQQLAVINPGLPVPPISMTNKEYSAWLSNQKTGSEMSNQAQQQADRQSDRERQFSIGSVKPRVAVDAKGKPVVGDDGLPQVSFAPLVNADGKTFLAANEGQHKTLSAKYLAASEITDILNEVSAIRDRTGGESKVWNSDDYQRLKQLEARLSVLAKSGTEGMSSDEDMRRLVSTLGAEDLTSFRARAAGLEEAKRHTKTELNKALRIANYTGPEIDFPNPYAAPTSKKSGDDIRDEDLLKKPAGGDPEAAFKRDVLDEYKRRTLNMSPEERKAFDQGTPLNEAKINEAAFSFRPDASGNVPGYDLNEPDAKRVKTNIEISVAQRELLNDVAARFDAGASLAQQRRIADLAVEMRNGGAAGERARELLGKVATSAHTQRLRALASQALSEAASSSMPETPPVMPADQSPAYETLPPPGGGGR